MDQEQSLSDAELNSSVEDEESSHEEEEEIEVVEDVTTPAPKRQKRTKETPTPAKKTKKESSSAKKKTHQLTPETKEFKKMNSHDTRLLKCVMKHYGSAKDRQSFAAVLTECGVEATDDFDTMIKKIDSEGALLQNYKVAYGNLYPDTCEEEFKAAMTKKRKASQSHVTKEGGGSKQIHDLVAAIGKRIVNSQAEQTIDVMAKEWIEFGKPLDPSVFRDQVLHGNGDDTKAHLVARTYAKIAMDIQSFVVSSLLQKVVDFEAANGKFLQWMGVVMEITEVDNVHESTYKGWLAKELIQPPTPANEVKWMAHAMNQQEINAYFVKPTTVSSYSGKWSEVPNPKFNIVFS